MNSSNKNKDGNGKAAMLKTKKHSPTVIDVDGDTVTLICFSHMNAKNQGHVVYKTKDGGDVKFV